MAQSHAQAQAAAQAQASQNANFMRYSYEQPFSMFAQNGTQLVQGQALNFDAPVVPAGYLTGIVLSVNATINYTPAATSPTVSLNAGGIWNVLNQVQVKFGETQITIHPYFEYVFGKMRGYNRPYTTAVNGYQNSDVQAMLYSAPTLNSGNNTWKFDIFIPMLAVHPNAVVGMLPLGQTGTKVQVVAIPSSSFVGADPLNNVINTNGTISVSGNVTATAIVRDYHSFTTTQAVQPSLGGLATSQTIKPQEINPLTGGTVNFRTLTNPYPLISAVSIVIDGASSSSFCLPSNINTLELDQAENTNTAFFRYSDQNGGMSRFYSQIRSTFGQDFEDGVLPWFHAPAYNISNPSSQGGDNYLDLTSKGFPAARLGVGVNSVNTGNGITPRVVTYAKILNPAGITLA